jgi:hypothetical protein
MIAAHTKEQPSLRQALHDMSQPLTRLQWRLELGRRGGEADLRDAVEGALADSLELIDWLRRIRITIEGSEGKAA